MNKEWITIKEASELLNITPQAIYKRLNQKNSTLKPLVKVVKNIKMIHTSALNEFHSTKFRNLSTNTLNTVEVEKPYKEIIELLKSQMNVLNKQAKVLEGQLEQKDKQINDLNERLEQALKNTSEGHFVLAQQQQKILNEPINESIPWYKKIFKK